MADKGFKEEEPKEVKRYILRETKVDRFTILRKRVLLTPSVCDECALDIRELNNIKPEYDKLPGEVQAKLKLAIAEHKKAAHDSSQRKIITEDQMPVAFLKELITKKDRDKLKEVSAME